MIPVIIARNYKGSYSGRIYQFNKDNGSEDEAGPARPSLARTGNTSSPVRASYGPSLKYDSGTEQ